MKDRFHLEDEISHLYVFSDQLGSLSKAISGQDLSSDEIIKVLEGLRILLTIHTQKLHDTMNQCFNLDEYREDTDESKSTKTSV